MSKTRRGPGALTWALVALAAAPTSVLALHKEVPQATRLTSGGPHEHARTRSWGDYYAFVSTTDLTGEGVLGPQVYVLSLLDYACQVGRPELRTPDEQNLLAPCPDPPRPWLVRATNADPSDEVSNPSVNYTGEVVAYEARGRHSGQASGPAASRRQIFIRNVKSGRLHPVTLNPDGDSTQPSLNENGGTLTFQSNANLLGTPTGISQVYMYSVPQFVAPAGTGTGVLRLVTQGVGDSTNPMLNQLGTHVGFQSRANLRGDKSDTGVFQIYLYDRRNDRVIQMTDGNADSRNPWVEEKRPGSIFFESDATDLPGTTGGPGTQIYQSSTRESELPEIRQWTFGPGNCRWPSVGPDGGRLITVCDGDLLQNGTGGTNRLFAWDFKDPAAVILYQVTGRGWIQGPVSASFGRWFATFSSSDDVAGTGLCGGRQLFLVDYDPDHYIIAGKQRRPATQLGEVPGEPFPGDPNDSCFDGDFCTTDVCNPQSVCINTSLPENNQCGPGDQCTGIGLCRSGSCVQQPGLECEDDNPCTDDSCDPGDGCKHTDVDCADDNPCTDDSCDPTTPNGCVHTPKPSFTGLECQNGQVDPPDGLKKKLSKKLSRAKQLVATAPTKRPRRQARLLRRASGMLEEVVSELAIDDTLPRNEVNAVLTEIAELIDMIKAVLDEIDAAIGGAR